MAHQGRDPGPERSLDEQVTPKGCVPAQIVGQADVDLTEQKLIGQVPNDIERARTSVSGKVVLRVKIRSLALATT
jgi:hypothetical protein